MGSWWSEEKCSELDRAGPALSSFLLSWLPSLFSTRGHYSDVQRIQVKCVSIGLVTVLLSVYSAHMAPAQAWCISQHLAFLPCPAKESPSPWGLAGTLARSCGIGIDRFWL